MKVLYCFLISNEWGSQAFSTHARMWVITEDVTPKL